MQRIKRKWLASYPLDLGKSSELQQSGSKLKREIMEIWNVIGMGVSSFFRFVLGLDLPILLRKKREVVASSSLFCLLQPD